MLSQSQGERLNPNITGRCFFRRENRLAPASNVSLFCARAAAVDISRTVSSTSLRPRKFVCFSPFNAFGRLNTHFNLFSGRTHALGCRIKYRCRSFCRKQQRITTLPLHPASPPACRAAGIQSACWRRYETAFLVLQCISGLHLFTLVLCTCNCVCLPLYVYTLQYFLCI